jgi:quercetin 2,3-dioxygenase
MQQIRRAGDRGHADHGWLESYHSFSFADYFDPAHVQFGPLRVINEDRVAPGAGFGTHGHRDMEIISYVLDGELAHKDSTGTSSTIRPGDVQRMSAGTGVTHSEFNASREELVHFLQIWIEPDRTSITPSYEQKNFPVSEKKGRLRLIVSPDGADGSVKIHQNARVYAAVLSGPDAADYALPEGHKAYVHVARGTVKVNGTAVSSGDGVKVTGERALQLNEGSDAEVLLFDLA